MDHDIAIRSLLEEPAGKDAVPLIVAAFLHVELYEGAGFAHIFPWRRRLAGTQPHNGIAHAQRFAGFHFQLTGNAVALVEQAQHGFPLRHRRAGQFGAVAGDRMVAGALLAIRRFGVIGSSGRSGSAACGQKQQAQRNKPPARCRKPAGLHASGVQAS